jgi:coenzyme PQQ biosynthesis protein PqqD
MMPLDPQSRPALGRGVRLTNDPITGEPVLLFPEGVLPLDAVTRDIITRCSGRATISSIILSLAEEYEADAATVGVDVCECLDQLRQRMLVAISA